ncbi:MAG: magnesium transporter [Bacteroidales bacterium]|nr:magnesium transporter [Bacteroidales bacterium]
MASQFELTKEYLEKLREVIGAGDESKAKELIQDLHAADIAELYNELSIKEARFLYLLLEGEIAADVLAELEEDDRERFLEVIPGKVIAEQFIDNMDTDDAADIIGELSEEKKEDVLQHIDDVERAGDIVDLLSYDEDSAGGLMGKELIKVNENWTIMKCLKEMSLQAENVDEVYYVYVVDDNNKLKGTVSLKKMLLAKNITKVKGIANEDVIYVKTDTSGEEVANIMDKYDLVALPVVDSIERLIGRITIDDVVDFIRDEAEKDYQMASGISEDIEHSDKVLVITRARLPWLLIGLIGGIFGALVISHYEGDLKINPQMAFFIPLIASMGGNVGIQSSAIVVQGLAGRSLDLGSTGAKIFKELLVAIINAAVLGSLIFAYNYFFTDDYALTFTVSLALMIVILFAALVGTLIPLVLHRKGIDPALATGPFITTMNDIVGIFLYLMIGKMMYGLF